MYIFLLHSNIFPVHRNIFPVQRNISSSTQKYFSTTQKYFSTTPQNTNRNRRATSVGAFDVYVAIFRARTREIPSGGHYSSKILSQDRSREYSKSIMEYLEVNRLILKFWQSFYILYQICTT